MKEGDKIIKDMDDYMRKLLKKAADSDEQIPEQSNAYE